MKFILGSVEITYEIDDGTIYPICKDIMNITGEEKVLVISDITSSVSLGVTDKLLIHDAISALYKISDLIIIWEISCDETPKDPVKRLNYQKMYESKKNCILELGFVSADVVRTTSVYATSAFVSLDGKGAKLIDYIAAKELLDNVQYALLPLCKAYVRDSIKHPIGSPIIDKLGTILHDSIESTVHMFNEQYIDPIVLIKEGKYEST